MSALPKVNAVGSVGTAASSSSSSAFKPVVTATLSNFQQSLCQTILATMPRYEKGYQATFSSLQNVLISFFNEAQLEDHIKTFNAIMGLKKTFEVFDTLNIETHFEEALANMDLFFSNAEQLSKAKDISLIAIGIMTTAIRKETGKRALIQKSLGSAKDIFSLIYSNEPLKTKMEAIKAVSQRVLGIFSHSHHRSFEIFMDGDGSDTYNPTSDIGKFQGLEFFKRRIDLEMNLVHSLRNSLYKILDTEYVKNHVKFNREHIDGAIAKLTSLISELNKYRNIVEAEEKSLLSSDFTKLEDPLDPELKTELSELHKFIRLKFEQLKQNYKALHAAQTATAADGKPSSPKKARTETAAAPATHVSATEPTAKEENVKHAESAAQVGSKRKTH